MGARFAKVGPTGGLKENALELLDGAPNPVNPLNRGAAGC